MLPEDFDVKEFVRVVAQGRAADWEALETYLDNVTLSGLIAETKAIRADLARLDKEKMALRKRLVFVARTMERKCLMAVFRRATTVDATVDATADKIKDNL